MSAGQEYLENLPEEPNEERNRLTMDAISNGVLTVEWTEVVINYKNHVGKFQITTDAAYAVLDDGSRFRPSFTASMAQAAADLVGGCLPTTKLLDAAYLQAETKLNATILSASSLMSSTTYSRAFNTKLEAKRAGRTDLVTDCGKAWLIDNSLAFSAGAVNYGFYDSRAPSAGPGGLRMWQAVGTRHNAQHQDYSQVLLLIGANCEIDGVSTSIADIAKDAELSHLINYSGILKYTKGTK